MTTRRARRIELAELALAVLDVAPRPDERPVFIGWIAWKLGIEPCRFEYQFVRRALDRLERLGLVERVRDWLPPPAVYWRRTVAGTRWEGTAADIARPIRRPR